MSVFDVVDLPFQSFKAHEKATTKIENCKKFFLWNNIWKNSPKFLAELPIVLCRYCGLLCVSSRRKRPIFWYGLQPIFAQPISADKQPLLHKSTKATASMFMDCLYCQSLALLNIRYRLICSPSVFDGEVYFQIATQRVKTINNITRGKCSIVKLY